MKLAALFFVVVGPICLAQNSSPNPEIGHVQLNSNGSTTSQSPPRIQIEVSSSSASTLKGSLHPLAQAQYDSGRVPADTRLNGISIVFNRSAAQQADLEALIAAQQNPSSPLYHQWLNPDQFAARFGMAQSDLNKVQTWLEQQGFSIDSVARSRNMIRFSGSVNQVEQTFQTQMHFYTIGGGKHFAPSTALTLPSALTPVVMAVRNLDDFRPRSMYIASRRGHPAFTSSVSGSVFFAPGDIKLAYGINTLISAGSTGAGQSIVIAGQSSILNSDIENFENAAGLTGKDPNQVLVPGSGSAQTFPGDEGESDLDIEWSGSIAPGADIFFVYTGSNTNFGVFDSIEFAVDEKIGNIISVGYGSCEPEMPAGFGGTFDSVFQQAAIQGQPVVAASGDSGSSACYESPTTTTPTLAVQEALAVSYPASSEYVTGVGGTEIIAADAVSGSTYWEATGSSDEITSLLQYIPEVAWNDDLAAVTAGSTTLSASGGGASTFYATKPSWQTGIPGIPADSKRDVPDVSFYASPDLPGYLFCTSDTRDWNTSQQASCNVGFRDSATQDLTVAGGTSFPTPIFAGMVAILNQAKGYDAGQGLINPTLYTLASNSTTYAAVFHDVTTGNNECPPSLGLNYCSTASEGSYTTGVGYDQVTGLGSVNLSALVTAWPLSTSTLIGTTTAVTAAVGVTVVGIGDTVTITVASDSGTTTPTGTAVNLSIDGGGTPYSSSGSTQAVTLAANGTATYAAFFATAGIHTIVAQYPGDSTHAASTGSVSITLTAAKTTPTVTVTPSPSSITTAQSTRVTIAVSGVSGSATPTGSVTLSSGTYTSAVTTLASGATVITVPAGSLATGTDTLTATYTPDSSSSPVYNSATGTSSITVTVTPAKTTPTVTVVPSASSITTVQTLTVAIAVGGTPTPTGSVTLSSGGYTSATTLSSGNATFSIPAGSLATGTDTLTASYTPDSNSSSIYNIATGTSLVTVTVPPKITPTVTVTPSASSITTAQALTVTAAVSGSSGNPTPTGTVTLMSGSYTSAATTLSGGSASINIPAGSLNTGSDTLTASYSGDSNYIATTGTAPVSVTVAVAPTPSLTVSGTAVSVTPGATSGNISTITVTPSGGFTGSVVLTAAVTSSPTSAQYPPTLSFGSTSPVSITGTNAGTAILTISTTAATSATLVHPKLPGVPWYAVGATLACLLLFGIPARRRRWQTMLGMLALIVAFSGGMLACGGSSGSGGGGGASNPGTTAGTYTVTVTGTSGTVTAIGTVSAIAQ